MAAPGALARLPMPENHPLQHPDDRVPLFGTWKAIYAAVALSAALVMVLLAIFSRWPF